ncbi:MAG: NAD-dependent malic enzyme [Ignavibacteria bacterium CG_4_9_14_0_2_um_filter_37_13]|nr:MAG: NAD-dependent malic enzyme [Ignavibacteria bacterium CG_4_9_14_0_2_um_filter_37_13]
MNTSQRSLQLHESHHGKLSVQSNVPINNHDDLSLAYTPGVAAPCEEIFKNPEEIYKYTMKANSVAVVTDGSSVLGLGNIGAAASLPVMEGKCILFKRFANIDAFPICINTQNTDEFIETVKRIVVPFGGINLEDIASPHCFEIEKRLKDELDIPVVHDDQHGTATVALAAIINALKVTGREISDAGIVISGAGAAGISIAKILMLYGARNLVICDRHGALSPSRDDIKDNLYKVQIACATNSEDRNGTLADMLKGADVFIGVSGPGIVNEEMISSMANGPIVIAMANPTPEIMPDAALAAGAAVVGTGRSDFPNQINNVLAFPGIFRGLLDARVRMVTDEMYVAAAQALASLIKDPSPEVIIPDVFYDATADAVAEAVKKCALSQSL